MSEDGGAHGGQQSTPRRSASWSTTARCNPTVTTLNPDPNFKVHLSVLAHEYPRQRHRRVPRRIVEKRIVAVRIPERRLHRRGALLLDLAVAWRPAATPGSGLVGVDRRVGQKELYHCLVAILRGDA